MKVKNFNFLVRENKLDRWVVNEVVERGVYKKYLNLTKNDIWLDIGAHIGTFSIDIASEVKKVFGYEPDKENFSLFKQNVKNNSIENIICFNSAVVGNQDKSRNFYLNIKKNTGSHSFLVHRGRKEIKVICENINDIINKYNINKIKIDCEGCEFEILKSIKDFSLIKEIIFEFHISILKKEKYFEIIEYLKNFYQLKYKEDIKKNWFTIVYGKLL